MDPFRTWFLQGLVTEEALASNGGAVAIARGASSRSIGLSSAGHTTADSGDDVRAPPGLTERSKLLGARRSSSINRGPGRGSTIADKMMAFAANARSVSRSHSEIGDSGGSGETVTNLSYGTSHVREGNLWASKRSMSSDAV